MWFWSLCSFFFLVKNTSSEITGSLFLSWTHPESGILNSIYLFWTSSSSLFSYVLFVFSFCCTFISLFLPNFITSFLICLTYRHNSLLRAGATYCKDIFGGILWQAVNTYWELFCDDQITQARCVAKFLQAVIYYCYSDSPLFCFFDLLFFHLSLLCTCHKILHFLLLLLLFLSSSVLSLYE